MSNIASSTTPKGTLPMPTRRATKHKRALYGLELRVKAAERRVRRAEIARIKAKQPKNRSKDETALLSAHEARCAAARPKTAPAPVAKAS